ncbi:DUF6665 family protein, partial [Caulobacter sp. S45]|uniref:DUF6665 family protein n=1 Tax=Caulobacter sp. S45 TaxID=1641861 RepID=UPI001C2D1081
STSPRFETGLSVLEAELRAEQALALGRLGRDLEASLLALSDSDAHSGSRETLVKAAAGAVWRYFVQREVCGLFEHEQAITYYAIPPEVLARVGAAD